MLTISQIAAIEKEGFKIPDLKSFVKDEKYVNRDENINGLILKDGTLILCNGYNEHRYIYPFLCKLGLVDTGDWTEDETSIHISSNQLNGYVSHKFTYKPHVITTEQVDTLFALRHIVDGQYGHGDNIAFMLYEYITAIEQHGGKYNGLAFLKRFYTNINLPIFSKEVDLGTIKNGLSLKFPKHCLCIRTSPEQSLPGLLNSKFNLINPDTYQPAIDEVLKDFDKYKDVIKGNKIHWFFQQQLDGVNGVCNVRGRERVFSYDASASQGLIVQGKTGSVKLDQPILNELKTIATALAKDMDRSIQLEFVVNDNKLYIVQFRFLKNEPEETVHIHAPEKALVFGTTFSKGDITVNVNDILIVDKDGDSSLLLGKKALIVRKKVEFSHLLALSKALRIPSMYATGKVDFGKRKRVKFMAYNKKSWIL